jgi:hypothetical protein
MSYQKIHLGRNVEGKSKGGFLKVTADISTVEKKYGHWLFRANEAGVERRLDSIINNSLYGFLGEFRDYALENKRWKDRTGTLRAGHVLDFTGKGASLTIDASINPQGAKKEADAFLGYAYSLENDPRFASKYAWIKPNWDKFRTKLVPFVTKDVTNWLLYMEEPVWVTFYMDEFGNVVTDQEEIAKQKRLILAKFERGGKPDIRSRDPKTGRWAKRLKTRTYKTNRGRR